MGFKILIAVSLFTVAAALPAKLLRTPKIYNALITTKEKLLPSEAYPATLGPIFQPIAFTGEPILLNPNEYLSKSWNKQPSTDWNVQMQTVRADEKFNSDSPNRSVPPVVFYPRYGTYYPQHTVVAYFDSGQQGYFYAGFDRSNVAAKSVIQAPADRYRAPRTRADLYPKNNVPSREGIPDVPPPPPPISYLNQQKNEEVS